MQIVLNAINPLSPSILHPLPTPLGLSLVYMCGVWWGCVVCDEVVCVWWGCVCEVCDEVVCVCRCVSMKDGSFLMG